MGEEERNREDKDGRKGGEKQTSDREDEGKGGEKEGDEKRKRMERERRRSVPFACGLP